jgi:hypothetical protein
MFKCDENDENVKRIVDFFKSYDIHKSHGRSIDRSKAREKGLSTVRDLEEFSGLVELIRSLLNQFEFWFDKTPFFKMFENGHGINWGRQSQHVTIEVPGAPGLPGPVPQPGVPERSSQQ